MWCCSYCSSSKTPGQAALFSTNSLTTRPSQKICHPTGASTTAPLLQCPRPGTDRECSLAKVLSSPFLVSQDGPQRAQQGTRPSRSAPVQLLGAFASLWRSWPDRTSAVRENRPPGRCALLGRGLQRKGGSTASARACWFSARNGGPALMSEARPDELRVIFG